MDDEYEEDRSPLDELASVVADLKTHLNWQSELGAHGIPRDTDLARKLAESPLPELSPSALSSATVTPPRPREDRAARGPSSPMAPEPLQMPDFGEETPSSRTSPLSKKAPPKFDRPDRTHLLTLGASLDELNAKVTECTQCELHQTRTQTVFSRGTGSSGLCFVGEGPGAEEDAQGAPFVGPAGQLLDKMIAAMGLDRDEVYVCNIVKCRPPNNRRPTPVEMQTCSPFLERQLDLLNPQVIVALGGTAVAGLLGITDGITRVRGRFRLYQGRIAVMPTFHPAYLLRNPAAKRQVWTDLRQVLSHMGRQVPAQG